MQPSMNFYPNQPQTNMPNFNPYNTMQDFYANRMNQMQQQFQQPQQTQQQFTGLNGKVVDDFGIITGNDVPMDNMGAIFVKSDGTEIQRRFWNATNGSIVTTSFKPIQSENPQEGTNTPQMDFNALNEDVRALREDIKDMRSMIEKSIGKIPTSRAKKGDSEE